jgi:hypothetical protein
MRRYALLGETHVTVDDYVFDGLRYRGDVSIDSGDHWNPPDVDIDVDWEFTEEELRAQYPDETLPDDIMDQVSEALLEKLYETYPELI